MVFPLGFQSAKFDRYSDNERRSGRPMFLGADQQLDHGSRIDALVSLNNSMR